MCTGKFSKEAKEEGQTRAESTCLQLECVFVLLSFSVLFLGLCRNACVWIFPCYLLKECNALPQRKIPSWSALTVVNHHTQMSTVVLCGVKKSLALAFRFSVVSLSFSVYLWLMFASTVHFDSPVYSNSIHLLMLNPFSCICSRPVSFYSLSQCYISTGL